MPLSYEEKLLQSGVPQPTAKYLANPNEHGSNIVTSVTNPVTGRITKTIAGGRDADADLGIVSLLQRSKANRRFCLFGNSIFASLTTFPIHMALASKGKLSVKSNLGVAGNTSAQMLARTASIPSSAEIDSCLILEGTNDVLNSVTDAAYVTNIKAIAEFVTALGVEPILCSPPPLNNNPSRTEALRVLTYSLSRSIPSCGYIDPFIGMYNASGAGTWASGLSGDGVHPVPSAEITSGILTQQQLQANESVVPLPRYPTNTYGLFPNALYLTDTNADGLADNWGEYGGALGSTTRSQVAISGSPAKFQKWVTSATSAGAYIAYSGATANTWSVGEKLLVVGRIKVESVSNGMASAYLTFEGASVTIPVVIFQPNNVAEQVFCFETPAIPAGTTGVQMNVRLENVSGQTTWSATLSLGEFQVYNLSRMPL